MLARETVLMGLLAHAPLEPAVNEVVGLVGHGGRGNIDLGAAVILKLHGVEVVPLCFIEVG